MTIIVNISDARATSDSGDTLVTYSLGSCIGVTLWDPLRRIGGMLHHQLPAASLDPAKAKAQPHMFADSGLESLLNQMLALGAEKKRLKVKIAGGAQMLNDAGLFNIGRRNHAAIRKALWQHGLFVDAEDVGGAAPRNLYLQVGDGTVTSKSGANTKVL